MGDFGTWHSGPTDAEPPRPPERRDRTRLLRAIAWALLIAGLGLCAVLWSLKGN